MEKICTQCDKSFDVFQEDIDLYEKVSPVFGGKKYPIPVPEICPHCRFLSRACLRNEHTYYKTTSSFSGKSLISLYQPNSPYKVYSYDEWWSDAWDAVSYGRDFDFDRGFFEQLGELFKDVPRINLIQDGTSENCEYTNFGAENKNCYLTMGYRCEDVYHSLDIFMSRDCVDCLHVLGSEKLYNCVSCEQCFNSAYLNKCNQCQDSYFLENCISCKNCIGCKNLRHKQFYIFNKPYSESEYFQILKDYRFDTHEGIEKFKKEYEAFALTLPCLFATQKRCENSTGDFLDGANNCHDCYIVVGSAENCRHCTIVGMKARDVIDSSNTLGELHCFVDGLLNSSRCLFSHFLRNCSEVSYSMYCYNSQNLFGCTGLVRKQYCIFNKQYSKEDYENLVPKIVEHMVKTKEWGVFFPLTLSAFGYNETFAYDMNPLTKDEALKLGFNWSDYKQDTENSGENSLICEVTGRPFRLIKQEITFYLQHGIPYPNVHPDVRIERRYRIRNPNIFWKRRCQKCEEEIVTTYDPKKADIVYCEKCYLKETY